MARTLKILVYVVGAAVVWASHALSVLLQVFSAFLISSAIGVHGVRRQSLSTSGA